MRRTMFTGRVRALLVAGALLAVLGAGCGGAPPAGGEIALATDPPPPTPSSLPTLTSTPPPTATPTPTPTETPPPTATPTPEGCLRPPDDYELVTVREGFRLNRRTLAMLEHAQELYGGEHDFLLAITQGSYNTGVEASFGTHDGGGAVDLAVRDLNNWHHILYEEVDAMISALRRAGFAAWLRDTDSLYPGSPAHIHAIAIGDAELSEAAQGQLTGEAGYFYGYDGLPVDPPQPDPHGGPIICPWMLEMGYPDMAVAGE